MEKKRKLKRFVMRSIYVALVAILVISTFATFANLKSVNEEEKINYVSNGIWTNDTPVASVEKVIVKPYTAKDVAIGRYFYDYRDEGTQQQNAIIFYENSYIQNSGVDYILDNRIFSTSFYQGIITYCKAFLEDEGYYVTLFTEEPDELDRLYKLEEYGDTNFKPMMTVFVNEKDYKRDKRLSSGARLLGFILHLFAELEEN